jgi:hypothetical protein
MYYLRNVYWCWQGTQEYASKHPISLEKKQRSVSLHRKSKKDASLRLQQWGSLLCGGGGALHPGNLSPIFSSWLWPWTKFQTISASTFSCYCFYLMLLTWRLSEMMKAKSLLQQGMYQTLGEQELFWYLWGYLFLYVGWLSNFFKLSDFKQ